MSKLLGADALRRRLKALSMAGKPLGRDWADETARLAKPMVPVRTGRLRKSIRRAEASTRRATVTAHQSAFYVDEGTKPHDIGAKRGGALVFKGRGGRTIFAKRVHHRGSKAQPFRAKAARRALDRTATRDVLIEAWNRGA